ncbi:hypothetical protein D8806_10900 [Streptococcus gordonii]|nr:hypothetical protein D8806_10900 [Streptococcus gordonii]
MSIYNYLRLLHQPIFYNDRHTVPSSNPSIFKLYSSVDLYSSSILNRINRHKSILISMMSPQQISKTSKINTTDYQSELVLESKSLDSLIKSITFSFIPLVTGYLLTLFIISSALMFFSCSFITHSVIFS